MNLADIPEDWNKLMPQEGKQTDFFKSSADIIVYGGAAGSGKSYALLLEAARNHQTEDFGAVIFRASLKQVKNQGGLLDESRKIYPLIHADLNVSSLTWKWTEFNSKVVFSHLDTEDSVLNFQGAQIPALFFDELTHFSKSQFFYMLSRNRSVCGVKPYVRATTNPDATSWVAEFIDWWIDDQGFPIPERSGVVRWFVNMNDSIHWYDTEEEALSHWPDIPPKSFTFISASIYDNKILMEVDKGYLANLKALGNVEQQRLLYGNWKIVASGGDYFKREWFEIVDSVPEFEMEYRTWDFAGTTPSELYPDPDYTNGLKGGIDANGTIYLTDMQRDRLNPTKVKQLLINTTMIDGNQVRVRIPQDPGSAGKAVAHDYIKALKGYPVKSVPVTGKKEVRAMAASAQAGIGNIKVLRGHWNDAFLTELESFPEGAHDDQVDVLSDLVEELSNIHGRVWEDFEDCDSVIKDFESVIIGAVFVPEHVCIVAVVKRGTELHIVDEIVALHDTREAISIMSERYENNSLTFYPSLTRRTKNATNNTEVDWKLVRNAGHSIKTNEYEVPMKELVVACNESLQSGRVKVNKYACPTLTLAMETQQYDGKGMPDNENNNFWVCEAFSYPIYNLLKVKRKTTTIQSNEPSNRVGGY